MCADGVAEHAVEGAVIDLAAARLALIVADRQAQIGAEFPGAQRVAGEQADEVLAIDFVELGEVVAPGEGVIELVVAAGQVVVLAGHAARKAAVLVVQRQVLVVGGVAVLELLQAPAGEVQARQVGGIEQAAFEGLREQAAVVGLQGRQIGDQGAKLQLRCGDLELGGQAELAVLVRRAAVVVGRQQAAAGTVRAGVELEAEHAQRVEADADGAGGVAGLEVEDEALCPFLALGLASAVTEVAVEIDILGLQGGAAVFDETGGVG
ncbi:hypothetical protein D3C81_1061420 [compost metagenome]